MREESQMNVKQISEQATMQSFLNCYLRETGEYRVLETSKAPSQLVDHFKQSKVEQFIHCELSKQGIHLYVPLTYWSVTGRHLFSFPVFYSITNDKLLKLDYLTLVSLVIKELTSEANSGSAANQDELMLRVILSCQNIEKFIRERYEEIDELYQFDMDFIDAEQALLFGHLLHPTPKSRQGISEWDAPMYSPELKGKFQLHYFRIHSSIIRQDTSLEEMTSDLIKKQLIEDPEVSEEFKRNYCQIDDYALLPIHPWQAAFLLRKPKVLGLVEQGLIESLGKQGRAYYPTSSIRTVYHPEADYMIKFSLNVKITNSVRANKYMELERGIEVNKLMDGLIGQHLKKNHPHFQVICDPAFITVDIDGKKESGFEVILRENPFKNRHARNATPIAALCQDSIYGQSSRLSQIIHQLAKDEGRTTEKVSLDWFRSYLNLSLKPIMWLFLTYGIAIEAHQQNSVIQLKGGYPDRFFYRDNQGYYYSESYHERLSRILPGISEKSNTVCSNAIADERLRYYFYFNHLFGMINAFGTGQLIDERKLLQEVRDVLEHIEVPEGSPSELIESLLTYQKLPCKANLLTRFHDMDELTGSLETQSVYVQIDNPLVMKELVFSDA